MPVESIFEEDHLRPVFADETGFVFFSALDGKLYRAPQSTSVRARYFEFTLTPGLAHYCVPGTPFVYGVSHTRNAITITKSVLAASTIRNVDTWAHQGFPSTEFAISAFVPDASTQSIQILLEPISDLDQCVFVDLTSGQAKSLHMREAIPKCVLSDGTFICELPNNRWAAFDSAGDYLHGGDGKVTHPTTSFAVIRQSSKQGNQFFLARAEGTSKLSLPSSWSIVDVGASDLEVFAYAVHARLGQSVFRATPDTLVFDHWISRCGTAQIFSVGATQTPVLRLTGLNIGSSWISGPLKMCGVAAPRSDINVEYLSIADVPCVRVSRSGVRCKNLVVSFHGGPDSHELDDLRYSGAYREWLDRNVDVLIINYPGSLGFGDAFQASAWGSWRQAVETVSRAIRHAVARHRYESVVAFGVSFGAWVAAQLSDLEAVERVVVMSPILSLTEHIERHSPHNDEFSKWASERFGADDRRISLPSNRSHKGAAPVFVLAATNDEIVSPGSTKSVADRATDLGHQWQLIEVPGRHYPASTVDAAKRWMVLKELVTQITTETDQSRRPTNDL